MARIYISIKRIEYNSKYGYGEREKHFNLKIYSKTLFRQKQPTACQQASAKEEINLFSKQKGTEFNANGMRSFASHSFYKTLLKKALYIMVQL